MKTVVSVCSARPNFVKVAAVHHALESAGGFTHIIVHTGQHYDPLLSDIFFEQLRIPTPAFNLGVAGSDRLQVIDQTEVAFAAILPEMKPDIVLVYGDVNGAVGAARAAKAGGYRIGHVEAGLRSFDTSMPEEHNRIAIDQLADFLFVSESAGMKHLEEEAVHGERFLVGNVMIDTLVRMRPEIEKAELPADLPSEFAVVTLHRPSNVDDPEMLRLNVDTLCTIASHIPLLLPVHHRLQMALEKNKLLEQLSKAVRLLPPLGYLPFLHLLSEADFILTDSGGIQEEATFLEMRCYTLRKNTERPATIESGSNILIDLQKEEDQKRLRKDVMNKGHPKITVPALWDGGAGKRIVEVLLQKI